MVMERQLVKSELPKDWVLYEANELIFDFRGGASLKPSDFTKDGVRVLPKSGVTRGGFLKINSSDQQYCSFEYAEKNKLNLVDRTYTIIVLRDLVPSGPNIGLMVKINSDEKYILAQGVYGFRVKIDKANSGYLIHLSNSDNYRKLMKTILVGSTQVHIRNTTFKKIKLALPPLNEQLEIVQVLSDVDGLIDALDKLIDKKKLIKQAAMQMLLAGQKRLPGAWVIKNTKKNSDIGIIPEDWDIKTLVNLCREEGLVRGPFGGSLKKEFFVDEGIKVYEQKNAIYKDHQLGSYFIDANKYNELRRFEVFPGEFIVSCSGTIGRIYQIPKAAPKGIINQALLKIHLDADIISDAYFYHYFDWEDFQKRIVDNTQGGAMKNLVGMTEFRNSLIALPSSKDEQEAIAQVLSAMDKDIKSLELKRDKCKLLKAGLMQQLLTGRIRLPCKS